MSKRSKIIKNKKQSCQEARNIKFHRPGASGIKIDKKLEMNVNIKSRIRRIPIGEKASNYKKKKIL